MEDMRVCLTAFEARYLRADAFEWKTVHELCVCVCVLALAEAHAESREVGKNTNINKWGKSKVGNLGKVEL